MEEQSKKIILESQLNRILQIVEKENCPPEILLSATEPMIALTRELYPVSVYGRKPL